MEYQKIRTSVQDRVGIITLDSPPGNDLSMRMIAELMDVLDRWEVDDSVRSVMIKSDGKDFAVGGNGEDLVGEMENGPEAGALSYAEMGGNLVQRIETYPKGTLAAATGMVRGGAIVAFLACDIRIAGENIQLKDSDIYYGLVASWGMSSLRLPIWIGRNKIMDFMFLNEYCTGRQAYELGLVSRVVEDETINESAFLVAKRMAKAAPMAVRYFKECVRKAIYHDLDKAREFELKASDIVYATEDAKLGVYNIMHDIDYSDFKGK